MSRSNPTVGNPNPSTRWHEWDGANGNVRYYDKTAQANITVPLPFAFILLDEMATIKGWHDASDSGIYSNEVRDTRQEVFVVRSFKGGELATGTYQAIRDRVGNFGGHFVANLYIAYRDADKTLKIGSLQFKGAALKSWMEFRKESRKAIYEKAVTITGKVEGKKGKVVFQTPTFALSTISEQSNAEALALDKELQAYLKDYLARTKDQASGITAEDYKKADAAVAEVSAQRQLGGMSPAEVAAAEQEASRQSAKTPPGEFVDDDEIPF